MVTPLPPRPNTAVTLLVSSANAAASRSWCSGRTTQNRDNVFMNNCWSYISSGPSAYAAGSAARRSAGPKASGSCVTAQAPHAWTERTSGNRLRRAIEEEAAADPSRQGDGGQDVSAGSDTYLSAVRAPDGRRAHEHPKAAQTERTESWFSSFRSGMEGSVRHPLG